MYMEIDPLRWYGAPSFCDVLPIVINNKIEYNLNNFSFPKSLHYLPSSVAQCVRKFTSKM